MNPALKFEATLLEVTSAGDLVFLHRGVEQRLFAAEGSVADVPSTIASVTDWTEVLGLTGTLCFALHPTVSAPALFSFCPYADQSMRRIYRLDDANALGWRSMASPAGFLQASPIYGIGA